MICFLGIKNAIFLLGKKMRLYIRISKSAFIDEAIHTQSTLIYKAIHPKPSFIGEAIHPKSAFIYKAICAKIIHELKPNTYPSHLHHHQQK